MSEPQEAQKRAINSHVDTLATVLGGAAAFAFISQLYMWFAP